MHSGALGAVSRFFSSLGIFPGYRYPVWSRSRRRGTRSPKSFTGSRVDYFRFADNVIEIQSCFQHTSAGYGQIGTIWSPYGDWIRRAQYYRIHLSVRSAEHHRHCGSWKFCKPRRNVYTQFSIFVLSHAANLYIAEGWIAYVDNHFYPPMLLGRVSLGFRLYYSMHTGNCSL